MRGANSIVSRCCRGGTHAAADLLHRLLITDITKDQERDVIILMRARHEGSDSAQDGLSERLSLNTGHYAVERFLNSIRSEQLAGRVHSFRDAVRIENE